MCDYQGYEFGARYPDSVCIEGRLFDADYCDDNGNLYDNGEDIPCPICRREDAIKWWTGRSMNGTHKERRARHFSTTQGEIQWQQRKRMVNVRCW